MRRRSRRSTTSPRSIRRRSPRGAAPSAHRQERAGEVRGEHPVPVVERGEVERRRPIRYPAFDHDDPYGPTAAAAAQRRATLASSVTSHATTVDRGVRELGAEIVGRRRQPIGVRAPASTTVAPSAASARAQASPMPDPPPVTRATCPRACGRRWSHRSTWATVWCTVGSGPAPCDTARDRARWAA